MVEAGILKERKNLEVMRYARAEEMATEIQDLAQETAQATKALETEVTIESDNKTWMIGMYTR